MSQEWSILNKGEIIQRQTRISCEGNLGQPQKENRVIYNGLVERKYPFYEVVFIWRDRREKALKIEG